MLKEDPRYDYVEARETQPSMSRTQSGIPASRRALRGQPKKNHLSLPVNFTLNPAYQCLPMQAYLAERFSHIGGKNHLFQVLRAENQRLHDHAATLGHLPMSRTS